MRFAILASAALTCAAACSSGELTEKAPPEMSPGTVTLRLLLPSTQTFCDQTDGCFGWQHIFISADPATLPAGSMPSPPPSVGHACAPQCSNQCVAQFCPLPAIVPCMLSESGVGQAVTNVETTWNG